MSHVVSGASSAALQGVRIAKSHGAKAPSIPGETASTGTVNALSGKSASSPAHGVRAQMTFTGAPGKAGLDQPFGQLVKAFLLQLQDVPPPPAGENIDPIVPPVEPPADPTAQTPDPLPPAV